jgi:hypothetical protein
VSPPAVYKSNWAKLSTHFENNELPFFFVVTFLINYLPVCRVVATTTCEVVTPYQDRPTEGFFRFDIEFSPMASPAFESGRYALPVFSARC